METLKINEKMSHNSKVWLAAQYILKKAVDAYQIWTKGLQLNCDEWEWNFPDKANHKDHVNPKNFPYVMWKGCKEIWIQSPVFEEAIMLLEDIGLIEVHPNKDYEKRVRWTGLPLQFNDMFKLDEIKDYSKWGHANDTRFQGTIKD